MIRTQSLAWAADWYYLSRKAFHVDINIYILLLRKKENVNLFLFFLFFKSAVELKNELEQ